jgi:hypothetical protein
MNGIIDYSTLKKDGVLLVRSDQTGTEWYRLNDRIYKAKYRSIGGFIGSAGWHIEDVTNGGGGCH